MKSPGNVAINGGSIKKYLYCGLLSFSLRLMRFLVNVAALRWLRFCPCHLRLVFAIKNIKRACNVPVLEPCSPSSVFTTLLLYSSVVALMLLLLFTLIYIQHYCDVTVLSVVKQLQLSQSPKLRRVPLLDGYVLGWSCCTCIGITTQWQQHSPKNLHLHQSACYLPLLKL